MFCMVLSEEVDLSSYLLFERLELRPMESWPSGQGGGFTNQGSWVALRSTQPLNLPSSFK